MREVFLASLLISPLPGGRGHRMRPDTQPTRDGGNVRRRKTKLGEDLAELVAMLPWWGGVLLAIVAYLLLHHVASQVAPVVAKPGQMGAAVTQSVGRGSASIGQYVVPLICLLGAGISAWRRRERKRLIATVVQSDAADSLEHMSWLEFERLVGGGFRLQGYRVAEIGGGGADGGVDVVLTKGGEKFLVQCKQWRAFRVSVGVVRELYGVMAARGAAGGFVVTSGRFTQDAVEFADGRNIELLDGPKLHRLLRDASEAAASESAAPRATSFRDELAPACPVCSRSMVKRVAKQGAGSGRAFWGCAGFPSCRGTRAYVGRMQG